MSCRQQSVSTFSILCQSIEIFNFFPFLSFPVFLNSKEGKSPSSSQRRCKKMFLTKTGGQTRMRLILGWVLLVFPSQHGLGGNFPNDIWESLGNSLEFWSHVLGLLWNRPCLVFPAWAAFIEECKIYGAFLRKINPFDFTQLLFKEFFSFVCDATRRYFTGFGFRVDC